jgi:hypothetical protein
MQAPKDLPIPNHPREFCIERKPVKVYIGGFYIEDIKGVNVICSKCSANNCVSNDSCIACNHPFYKYTT